MMRYIGLVIVFILLASLVFLTIPQGYLPAAAGEPRPGRAGEAGLPDGKADAAGSQEAQQKQASEKSFEQKVNEAVDKGVEFLLARGIKGRETELMVLTLLHAGVDQKRNSALRTALGKLKTNTLGNTYRVAFTAMALEKADPYKYQQRIAQCAQAIVNYQCENGQWHYSCRYNMNFGIPKRTREKFSPPEENPVISGRKHKHAKPLHKIIIERGNEKRGLSGDNSCTQFALLGLRSAARCGIQIPQETWQDAADYLTKIQAQDGGWSYVESKRSYGGMTCASLCGLAIAKFYLNPNQNLLEDPSIKKGLNWLANRLTFQHNPGPHIHGVGGTDCYLYYYIYGVERVGSILKTKRFRHHNWYQEGAKYLLGHQAEDGSWNYPDDDAWSNVIADTCFAILFLKRATPPLKFKPVISGQSKEPSPPDDSD